MPRVAIPVTQITRAGVAPAAEVNGDATNNHSVVNTDGQTIILVRNSGAGARVVTVQFSRTVDGSAVAAKTYSIVAAASRYIGPFPTGDYGTSLSVDVEHAELKLSAYHA